MFSAAAATADDIYTCRTEAVKPGGRCWLWFPKGGNMVAPQVPPGWTWSRPARGTNEWHNQWAWQITVSSTATPGTYDVGGVPITVVKPHRVAPFRRIKPTDTVDTVQRWADHGYHLELEPGLHRWNKSLMVPDGLVIRSAGSVLMREQNGESFERLFCPLGEMTLDGLVMTHSPDIATEYFVCVHQFPLKPGNVTVRNCVVRGGCLTWQQGPGWVVERCRFERAGTGDVADRSVWIECDFVGRTRQGHHPFSNGGVPCLVASCNWDRTNRGIVCQGPVHGMVAMDCTYTDIGGGGVYAGSEVILLETGPGTPAEHAPRDNTFIDHEIRNCAGPAVNLFGSGHRRNWFWGIDADVENTGLMIAEFGGGEQDGNQFVNWQTTGGVDVRGNVGAVAFSNFHFLETVQRRGNQGPFAANLQHFNTHFPFYRDDLDTGTFTFSGSGIVRRDRSYVPIESIDFTLAP